MYQEHPGTSMENWEDFSELQVPPRAKRSINSIFQFSVSLGETQFLPLKPIKQMENLINSSFYSFGGT